MLLDKRDEDSDIDENEFFDVAEGKSYIKRQSKSHVKQLKLVQHLLFCIVCFTIIML